ncbi:MAG: DUF2062 domain-containing protein [Gammaproteobacteria bacterium]|nr:DUF2062 domain-containing protein [Gammaproteobacteria bacterium]
MMKRYLKKWLPKPQHLYQPRPGWFHTVFYDQRLWYLNRQSLARGVGLGLLVAFVPFPGQMLMAALLAYLFRGNLAAAVVMTWITNPLTFLPINYFIFKVGQWVMHDVQGVYPMIMEFNLGAPGDTVTAFVKWIRHLSKPFLIGLPFVALSAAFIGYAGVLLVWRLMITLQWVYRKRKRVTRKKRKRENR